MPASPTSRSDSVWLNWNSDWLEIDERTFGPDHPTVSRDLNNLAQLLRKTDRVMEAESLMRRALEIGEQFFGLEHPRVTIGLDNLARLLQATNQAEAEPLMRRNLEILVRFGKATGHEHPNMQAALTNYRRLLEQMGRSQDAIESAVRSLTQ